MSRRLITAVSTCALFVSLPVQAATLLEFNFSDNNTTADYVAPGFAAAIITDGGTGSSIVTGDGNPVGSISLNGLGSSSNGGANTAGDYLQFTLAPNPGTTFDIDSISFEYKHTGSSGTRGGSVRTSVDGFTGGIAGYGEPAVLAFNTSSATFPDAAGYINLTGPVTFRIIGFAEGAARNILYDNIIITGTATAVPEPTTIASLALGATAFLARRRR